MLGRTKVAQKLGAFLLYYLMIMIASLWGALLLGLNPTLVLSVISAPYWICAILITVQLTKRIG